MQSRDDADDAGWLSSLAVNQSETPSTRTRGRDTRFYGRAPQSAEPIAIGKTTGETFQYIVKTPVTVNRGESAMVPILASKLPYGVSETK